MLLPADQVVRKSRSAGFPISLASAVALLVSGAIVLGWLFGTQQITLRRANFPGIGIGTNVGGGTSLGFGWIVESGRFQGYDLKVTITAFWAYVLVTAASLLLVPVELAFRHRATDHSST